jgi:hypothetical protein
MTRSCLPACGWASARTQRRQPEATYYSPLLTWVGYTAESHEVASLLGDDVALRVASYDIDFAGLPPLQFLVHVPQRLVVHGEQRVDGEVQCGPQVVAQR